MPAAGATSRAIHQRLKHPIIDSDGHAYEFQAPLEDYVKAIGGSEFAVRFTMPHKRFPVETDKARRDSGSARVAWWPSSAKNTLDRATAALPKLLYERLDDMGLDFSVLFSALVGAEVYRPGSSVQNSYFDPELRRIRERSINAFRADIWREYADRVTPAAAISMNTPREAIEDLEYAIKQLHLKVISISSVVRPVPDLLRRYPDLYRGRANVGATAGYLDTFGLDSDYDYDPFWAKCVELQVPVMSHGGGMGFTSRNSPSNYVYNHIGNFADGGEAICKSLFLGGVTRRFPTLRFAFLEGGVAWACRLYVDLITHWKKRNREAIQNYDPAQLDRTLLLDLHARYGGRLVEGRLEQVFRMGAGIEAEPYDDPALLDEFAAARIQRAEDIHDLFSPPFFFGCEADDPLNAWAFNPKGLPYGARLNAILSSDISHWDVVDMTKVLEEAYELVEDGVITPDDFKDFTFANPVRLFAGMNPSFFKGTKVEKDAEKFLKDEAGGRSVSLRGAIRA